MVAVCVRIAPLLATSPDVGKAYLEPKMLLVDCWGGPIPCWLTDPIGVDHALSTYMALMAWLL